MKKPQPLYVPSREELRDALVRALEITHLRGDIKTDDAREVAAQQIEDALYSEFDEDNERPEPDEIKDKPEATQ